MNWRDAEREYEDEVIGETTLARLFEESAARNSNRPAQQYKGGVYERSLTDSVIPAATSGEFRTISYAEMRDIVRRLSAGFRDLGVETGDRIGLFANTRMEWAQSDFALLGAGAVVTTVYTSSSPAQVEYLLDDPDADGVVVENEALLETVLSVEDALDLEFIVSMDDLEGYDDRDDILTLGDVYARGEDTFDLEAYEARIEETELDDLASLIYTSGTTGQPKGVQLTHGNFRSNVNASRKRFGPRPDKGDDVPVLSEESVALSYLPLAHVFERTAGHFVLFASGACIAYAESPDTLREDFGLVEPTTATSVPRVYEKIYDGIREEASQSAAKQRIFEWATDVGVAYQQAESPGPILSAKQALADTLVFSTVREALGGNIEILISGGGSLSPELCRLYHAMGLPIFEGYGLTETAPIVATNPPEAAKIGTIGPPLFNVEVTVDETVADQEAFADDPGEVGELLVRGPNVTQATGTNPARPRVRLSTPPLGRPRPVRASRETRMRAKNRQPRRASGSAPATSSTLDPTATLSSATASSRSSSSRREKTSRPGRSRTPSPRAKSSNRRWSSAMARSTSEPCSSPTRTTSASGPNRRGSTSPTTPRRCVTMTASATTSSRRSTGSTRTSRNTRRSSSSNSSRSSSPRKTTCSRRR